MDTTIYKNYGLDLTRESDEVSDDDYLAGVSPIKCIAEIPVNERERCLPAGEVQRTAKDDMMDCASRSPVNQYETKFNWLSRNNLLLPANRMWLNQNGYFTDRGMEFSDAYIAIRSKTTRDGNSLKAPMHACHEWGFIPKYMLPLEEWMTFEDYHNPVRINPKMEALGKEFLRRFTLNYERVYAEDFDKWLDRDVLGGAGYAWPEPIDGEYPRVSYTPNHAFMILKKPKSFIFDNYRDTAVDNDFIKKLAVDYEFLGYGYHSIISSQQVPAPVVVATKRKSFWDILLETLFPATA